MKWIQCFVLFVSFLSKSKATEGTCNAGNKVISHTWEMKTSRFGGLFPPSSSFTTCFQTPGCTPLILKAAKIDVAKSLFIIDRGSCSFADKVFLSELNMEIKYEKS